MSANTLSDAARLATIGGEARVHANTKRNTATVKRLMDLAAV
jgi:hypothetical protein